jgi:hypothetical protein
MASISHQISQRVAGLSRGEGATASGYIHPRLQPFFHDASLPSEQNAIHVRSTSLTVRTLSASDVKARDYAIGWGRHEFIASSTRNRRPRKLQILRKRSRSIFNCSRPNRMTPMACQGGGSRAWTELGTEPKFKVVDLAGGFSSVWEYKLQTTHARRLKPSQFGRARNHRHAAALNSRFATAVRSSQPPQPITDTTRQLPTQSLLCPKNSRDKNVNSRHHHRRLVRPGTQLRAAGDVLCTQRGLPSRQNARGGTGQNPVLPRRPAASRAPSPAAARFRRHAG